MPGHDTAILYLAHVWNEPVARRFERLRREAGEHSGVHLLLQDDGGEVTRRWRAFLASIDASASLFTFDANRLPGELGWRYFGPERIMSNTHFPLMAFARAHPHYQYLWQVECDVEYRGHWGSAFAPYRETDADLIAAHIHRFADWPDWIWWQSVSVPEVAGPFHRDQLFKAFMAVMRLSRAAIGTIEQAHRDGWLGHFEAVIPTVLLKAGRRLEDLNVRQRAYMGFLQDSCQLLPLQATIRCRPYVGLSEFVHRGEGPLFFHPVKEYWTWNGEKVVYWPQSPT